ncbi:acyl-CoA dehydrogenase family protein [Streptomyces sp. NPDC050619]|uniref:acyl-CoA dehydrogenase family protein n=1 Tax=Streptomyces sp. NPDC050619 TaxID=3157214 RepID=UPI003444729E
MKEDDFQERVTQTHSVAAANAYRVDLSGVFPAESVEALRKHGLIGLTPYLVDGEPSPFRMTYAVRRVSSACGSSGMILAMHLSHLLGLHEAAPRGSRIARMLVTEADGQPLFAGITSEAGSASIRESIAFCRDTGDGYLSVTKRTNAASFLEQADLVAVSARSKAEASSSDQVLLIARSQDLTICRTGDWRALGMRGTATISADIECRVEPDQVLQKFGEHLSRSLMPYIQLAWVACWEGISARAVQLARASVRRLRAKGHSDLVAVRMVRLGEITRRQDLIATLRGGFENELAAGRNARLTGPWPMSFGDLTRRANQLRLSVSQEAVQVAMDALEVTGLVGYLDEERSGLSLGRNLRDLLSSKVMVSPDSVRITDGLLALTAHDEA